MALPSVQEWAAVFDRLAPAMLGVAAGSAVVLGLAGLAALAMRRASAAARHEVWVMGFAGVLLLPVLSATLPGWHVLPRPGASRNAPRVAEVVVEVTGLPLSTWSPPSSLPGAQPPAARVADSTRSTHDEETIMDATSESKRESPSAGRAGPPPAAITPATPPRVNPPASPPPQPGPAPVARSAGLPWTAWLLLCWSVGSLLALGRVLLGHLGLWWLRRRRTGVARVTPVTRGEWFDLLQRLRGELGLRRPVELLSSPMRTMPMTWGLWRARLLVPGQAADWPPGQRRDVLLHELGHVKRWDCLTQLLSQLACALYWFNPLAWVANRRMQVERERACDDLVLNSGSEARSYARHLLQSVSAVPALRLAGAAVAMARPSTLEERMRAILDARLNRRALTPRGSLATVLLLMLALVPAAVLRAQQDPPQDPPVNSGTVRTAQPALGGGDGSPDSPQSPTTRPAAGPQSGRPTFRGARGGGSGGFGGFAGGRGDGFGGPTTPDLGNGPTCTFDATIYDVRLPVDQIGKLDVDALAKAAQTPDAFETALAALGKIRPMYRANQSVRLSGDTLTIGSMVPIVMNSQTTATGQTLNTVRYQNFGAIFTVVGKTGAPGGIDLDLGVQVSSSSEGGVALSDSVTAPVVRKATLSHKGPVQPRKPFVVLSVNGGSTDKDGKAVAYIGRITVGEPQPPGPR